MLGGSTGVILTEFFFSRKIYFPAQFLMLIPNIIFISVANRIRLVKFAKYESLSRKKILAKLIKFIMKIATTSFFQPFYDYSKAMAELG
jgi:hypothetical protein